MCGRYALTLPHEAMAQLFAAVPGNDLPQGSQYNLCPTQAIAVCTSESGSRRLQAMRWGFLPHWYKKPNDGPLLINARADTIADKPAFRTAVRLRRCLIPADGFYEWTRAKGATPQPWYIRRADGQPLVFAGIWQDWEQAGTRISTCAIVTTEAGPGLAPIHHRAPVTLEPPDWPLRLGEAGHGAARLMRAAAEGVLASHRVGQRSTPTGSTGRVCVCRWRADGGGIRARAIIVAKWAAMVHMRPATLSLSTTVSFIGSSLSILP